MCYDPDDEKGTLELIADVVDAATTKAELVDALKEVSSILKGEDE